MANALLAAPLRPQRMPSGSEDSGDQNYDDAVSDYYTLMQEVLPPGWQFVRGNQVADPSQIQIINGYQAAPVGAFKAQERDLIGDYGPLLAGAGLIGAGMAAAGAGAAGSGSVNALAGMPSGGYSLAFPGAGIGGVGSSGLGLTAGGGMGLAQTAATGGALTSGLASAGTGGGMGILDSIFSANGLSSGAANLIGNIGGGLLNYFGAQSAADTQANAAGTANNTLLQMYNQNRADAEPYRTAGVNALGQLAGNMGELTRSFGSADFNADPGYNFRLKEGLKAIESSAAARGLLQSGGNLKGVNRYAQDSASQEYGNAYNRFQLDQGNKFNRLAALSGIGQTANQQLGSQGMATAQGIGQNQLAAGNAQAAGQVGGMNAITGAIGNTLNYANQNALLDRLMRGSSYGA